MTVKISEENRDAYERTVKESGAYYVEFTGDDFTEVMQIMLLWTGTHPALMADLVYGELDTSEGRVENGEDWVHGQLKFRYQPNLGGYHWEGKA